MKEADDKKKKKMVDKLPHMHKTPGRSKDRKKGISPQESVNRSLTAQGLIHDDCIPGGSCCRFPGLIPGLYPGIFFGSGIGLLSL